MEYSYKGRWLYFYFYFFTEAHSLVPKNLNMKTVKNEQN